MHFQWLWEQKNSSLVICQSMLEGRVKCLCEKNRKLWNIQTQLCSNNYGFIVIKMNWTIYIKCKVYKHSNFIIFLLNIYLYLVFEVFKNCVVSRIHLLFDISYTEEIICTIWHFQCLCKLIQNFLNVFSRLINVFIGYLLTKLHRLCLTT